MTEQQEREAFEAWAATYSTMSLERDDCPELGTIGYKEIEQEMLWQAWEARAALATKAVPAGWKLVPVEPTRDMIRAAVIYANGNAVYKNVAAEALAIEESIYGEVWDAMLAATPPAPAPEAKPLKERPDFIAGYDAGLIDGRACERRDQAEADHIGKAAQAKPLTDEQIDAMWRKPMWYDWENREFARAIERAHGIGASAKEGGK